MVDLGTLGGTLSHALAVNARGMVVGWSSPAGDTVRHAFAWTKARGMLDLGTLGGSHSEANAVNLAGFVVGVAFLPGNAEAHPALWKPAAD